MKKLINYVPQTPLPDFLQDVELLAACHEEDMSQGYALPVIAAPNNDFTWLVFKEVEDHIDGNGWAVLYLARGQGTFYLEGEALSMNEHDTIIFSDNLEHGFSAEENCLALNLSCFTQEISIEDIKNRIEKSINATHEIIARQNKNRKNKM